jgi:tRNA-specific 2-thiouridylase
LLWSRSLSAQDASWINGPPAGLVAGRELPLTAKVRYRQADARCRVSQDGAGRLQVNFAEPQWAIAGGQYVVFYAGDECLGGAVIVGAESAAEFTPARTRTA